MATPKAPEAEEAPSAGYRVVLPPARHIPLTVNDVVDSLRNQVPHAQRAVFEEICQIVEGLALTEFSTIRRRVKKNFRFFSQAAMHRDVPTRRGRGCAALLMGELAVAHRPHMALYFRNRIYARWPPMGNTNKDRVHMFAVKKEETMDEMEVVFLADFWCAFRRCSGCLCNVTQARACAIGGPGLRPLRCHSPFLFESKALTCACRDLMDYAHYSALSEADWLAVKQERLMLDMPLTINWDHMDARLLDRFFTRRPQRLQSLYRCATVSDAGETSRHREATSSCILLQLGQRGYRYIFNQRL